MEGNEICKSETKERSTNETNTLNRIDRKLHNFVTDSKFEI